jgi:hypothetical protein
VNHWAAVNKFIEDVETQYNTKVGFELQTEDLKSEIQKLRKELDKESQKLKAQPFVGPVITGLLQRGLTEPDILNLADRCHNEISNRTYSVEVLRKVIINFLQNIMTDCVVNASMYTRSKK